LIRRLGLLLLLLLAAPAEAQPLPRIVSLSVCADQYLLTLAAPEQIAGLSPQARDPSLSFNADAAQRFPLTNGRAEEVLALHPDIALSDGYANATTLRLLNKIGVRMVLLPDPQSFADVEVALRSVGAAIGRAEAGEAAAQAFEARRAALAATIPAHLIPALYLIPTGATAGQGTYVDEVLGLAGFSNEATRRGIGGWRRLSLEELLLDPPPHVIMSFMDRNADAVGMSFGTNPVRERIPALAKPIDVPNALWPCAGPMLVDAAAYLRERLPR
jgi:iron complex transport system substrate-binding protein